MNCNIKKQEKEIAQIASAVSDVVVEYVKENKEIDIGDIEARMRQML